MSVDLRSNSTLGRMSFILMDGYLIQLEHRYTEDRVRKFRYESIDSVIIWQKAPWLRMILCAVILGLPGIAILFFSFRSGFNSNDVGETFMVVTGSFLCALAVGLITWYFYCKKTTIRIVRAGNHHDLSGMFRPGRLNRFRTRLVDGIRNVQSRLQAQHMESSPAPD